MHIPNGTTAELELLTFEDALKAAEEALVKFETWKQENKLK